MWIVVYAKIIEDKISDVQLAGVHFGGVANSKTEADKVARDCVNSVKGGTIMPKLYEVSGKHQLPLIMAQANDFFAKREEEMRLTATIVNRSLKRR